MTGTMPETLRLGDSPARGGLRPTRRMLDNGCVILARHTAKTPAVTISLSLRAGTINDPADAVGAINLLARVIDRGTATRSAARIADELDSRGIALTVTVNRHLFTLACTCLAADFEPVLALLGEIVTSPTIPDSELATRKGEVITAIRQDEDNPGVRATEKLMAMLYGPQHPYGRPVKGTVATIEALTRQRLTGLHASRFAPTALMAVVVGDVEVERACDAASRVFGGWTGPLLPAVELAPVPPAAARQRVSIPMMNKAQVDVAYGFVAVARSDPSYYAWWLMNNALGQYALGGRLGDRIRERQGMAYYVSSGLDANVIPGPLIVRAGVSPANVSRTIDAIDEELVKVRREGLTARELAESRQYLIGAMPRALETNFGIANFLQTGEFFGLGLDYDERLPDLLGAVTLDDVNAAARRVLDPDRATIVIAGPYERTAGPEDTPEA
jgi:zinc protease